MVIFTLAFNDDSPELTHEEIERAIAELERQLAATETPQP
jgi:hypothetical protein